MTWRVVLSRKAKKNLIKLPKKVHFVLQTLMLELEHVGANPGAQWPNLGKLRGSKGKVLWHCHLIKGNPTYVACWEMVDKNAKLIEVYYVGTHEKAPY